MVTVAGGNAGFGFHCDPIARRNSRIGGPRERPGTCYIYEGDAGDAFMCRAWLGLCEKAAATGHKAKILCHPLLRSQVDADA